MSNKRILFVCPYPFDEAPSQRFRFEQYLAILKENGYSYQLKPFFSLYMWRILYKKGKVISKAFGIFIAYIKRFFLLFTLHKYAFIFIHREATPAGPPFFEWATKYIWKKKIIYDFDDAIWLEDPNETGTFKSTLKWKKKVKKICNWSYKISCGNQYLANYASQFNKRVVVNPTTLDTENLHKISINNTELQSKTKVTIGWTGTHTTLQYLQDVIPALEALELKYDFSFLVISNQKPDFNLKSLKFIAWNKTTEIQDLDLIDIGIMPLSNDIWSKGKCGFKALQYMALAKPVIASPVGVNEIIVEDNVSGLHAETKEDWINALEKLLQDEALSIKMGLKGLQKVEKYYTVKSNKNNFLSLFQ
ncbi:group 1 glycosyl transferase [Marivirga lumbricoides]|uniref:Group 1 glycosyl transferase n=1 Tax=Marivirga lumbricoides TaxID=1046115 RepID=A0A2T4DHM4_9BACT|nr:group 1 glycosyl transferase [Marivirga lumbricoides]